MDDIVIVGAGPVGLMLACELGLAGVRPIVLEKRAEPSLFPKANGLGGQIVELLDHRGLLERFSVGSPFAGRAPGFPFGGVPLRFAHLGDVPLRLLLIQQPKLERLLTERALELGAEIRRGPEVRSLAQDEEGVTLGLADGARIRARYVAGCDGPGSLVRDQAGIAFEGTTDEEGLVIGHFRADATVFDGLEGTGLREGWTRTPHGRLLLTSLHDGVLIAGVREAGPPPEGPVTLADFQAAVRRVVGRELPLGEPIWLSGTVSQGRLAERYRAGRVFVAGDAAHLFPAGGSALNVGMTDAANLGWKLAARLRGRVPDAALDTYEAERRPVGARTLLQTRAQAAIDRADGPDGEALREVLAEVFAFEQPTRHLAGLLQDAGVRYGGDEGHPLVGRFVPDLALADGTRVAGLMRRARPVLLDLTGACDPDDPTGARDPKDLTGACDPDAVRACRGDDWIEVVSARCDDPPADALLIRPDGYVAWAGGDGLAEAARKWFGLTASRV